MHYSDLFTEEEYQDLLEPFNYFFKYLWFRKFNIIEHNNTSNNKLRDLIDIYNKKTNPALKEELRDKVLDNIIRRHTNFQKELNIFNFQQDKGKRKYTTEQIKERDLEYLYQEFNEGRDLDNINLKYLMKECEESREKFVEYNNKINTNKLIFNKFRLIRYVQISILNAFRDYHRKIQGELKSNRKIIIEELMEIHSNKIFQLYPQFMNDEQKMNWLMDFDQLLSKYKKKINNEIKYNVIKLFYKSDYNYKEIIEIYPELKTSDIQNYTRSFITFIKKHYINSK